MVKINILTQNYLDEVLDEMVMNGYDHECEKNKAWKNKD